MKNLKKYVCLGNISKILYFTLKLSHCVSYIPVYFVCCNATVQKLLKFEIFLKFFQLDKNWFWPVLKMSMKKYPKLFYLMAIVRIHFFIHQTIVLILKTLKVLAGNLKNVHNSFLSFYLETSIYTFINMIFFLSIFLWEFKLNKTHI